MWRFRSDVLRDVAYEGLAKRERQRLHLRVANRLAERETAERYPRSIAFHLEQAARAALDLNPKDRVLAERAVEALTHAGDLARRRDRVAGRRRPLRTRARDGGPRVRLGRARGPAPVADGRGALLAGRVRGGRDHALQRALEVDRGSVRVLAHASRYLADITLTIRAEPERAEELFAQALGAAREVGEPEVLSRTLLMAGWAPYCGATSTGRARCSRRPSRSRAAPPSRPVGRGTGAGGPGVGDLAGRRRGGGARLALQALEVGRDAGQPFTTAVARETVSGSLRRMMRLDEALEHSDAAIRTFRELGARWELASAIGDRGTIHRLQGGSRPRRRICARRSGSAGSWGSARS